MPKLKVKKTWPKAAIQVSGLSDERKSVDIKITGVFKDIPENSHVKFNMLLSYGTNVNVRGDYVANKHWGIDDSYTYIQVKPGTNAQELEENFPEFIEIYTPYPNANINSGFILQPLNKIHLHSDYAYELEINGDAKTLNFLLIIAIFILIIAWINYINLSGVKSLERAKEVGIRKVVGAFRWKIISQFILEFFIINLNSYKLMD